MSEQIRPLGTLACCWDVKQPTNKQTNAYPLGPLCIFVGTVGKQGNQRCSLLRHEATEKQQLSHKDNDYDDNDIGRRKSRFFRISSSLRRQLSTTLMLKWPRHNRVQIMCKTMGPYHVQCVVRYVVGRDSSAVKCDRVEIAFACFISVPETINH